MRCCIKSTPWVSNSHKPLERVAGGGELIDNEHETEIG